jgi:hypothetical protein
MEVAEVGSAGLHGAEVKVEQLTGLLLPEEAAIVI